MKATWAPCWHGKIFHYVKGKYSTLVEYVKKYTLWHGNFLLKILFHVHKTLFVVHAHAHGTTLLPILSHVVELIVFGP